MNQKTSNVLREKLLLEIDQFDSLAEFLKPPRHLILFCLHLLYLKEITDQFLPLLVLSSLLAIVKDGTSICDYGLIEQERGCILVSISIQWRTSRIGGLFLVKGEIMRLLKLLLFTCG